jgi:hypothetical protein
MSLIVILQNLKLIEENPLNERVLVLAGYLTKRHKGLDRSKRISENYFHHPQIEQST